MHKGGCRAADPGGIGRLALLVWAIGPLLGRSGNGSGGDAAIPVGATYWGSSAREPAPGVIELEGGLVVDGDANG